MCKLLALLVIFSGELLIQTELPSTVSKTENIYGLYKFTNEVNYNFVYLNKIDKQKWESDYISLIQGRQN